MLLGRGSRTIGVAVLRPAADAAGGDRGQAGFMTTYAELAGLMTRMTGDEKHGPSATSTLDVLWVLAEISADLFAKAAARHPDRVLNVGIREPLMVSVGGGLALAGMRSIVHTYAPFLTGRAFEQVKLDLGHQDAHAVLVSVGASYDSARSGRTHQAPEDVALIDTVPGFSVLVPGHPGEGAGAFGAPGGGGCGRGDAGSGA